MANRGRFIVAGQKTVTKGSSEPEFQGDRTWTGIYEDIQEQDPYFYSYSHFGIHEEMIKDSVRTDGYMHAIMNNPHLFQGKIVLDIGCGTGILSIFASRAGAAHVYGIDAADVAYKAQEIVRDNGLADRITILKSKVEEAELPVEKVDIIISEWMGYFLLYESMLDTVIYARDRWLKPEGLMFPDTATHWFAAIEDAEYKENKIGFWDSVYGFNMSAMKPLVMSEPIVDYVESQSIVTSECCLFSMNLKTVKIEDLEFAALYSITATRNDYVHALVNWFEVEFNHGQTQIKISTSPTRKATHWKQTVFYLDDVLPMNNGEVLHGSIAVRRNPEHPRDIDIKVSYHFDGAKHTYHDVRFYKLK